MSRPVCVVVGVGPGNGAAFAHRFADEGYAVGLLARSEDYLKELEGSIEGSRTFPYDAGDPEGARETFSSIERELGPVETLIYNAGSGVFANIEETTVQQLETAWRVNTLGLMVAAQQVIPGMRERGQGSIVVIGATASLRGGANFAPFASAKAAQRSLAQSMARHLGPAGIHVAYVVIDGMIDLPRTRERLPDRPDEQFLRPADIAESVLFLTRQPASAWTFELDVRPFTEKW